MGRTVREDRRPGGEAHGPTSTCSVAEKEMTTKRRAMQNYFIAFMLSGLKWDWRRGEGTLSLKK